jgi:hypothetical protein
MTPSWVIAADFSRITRLRVFSLIVFSLRGNTQPGEAA